MSDEVIDLTKPYKIFDPVHTWKKKTVKNFYAVELQKTIFENGKLVYEKPSLEEIREYSKAEIDKLWEEVTRFENPHTYYVDLSKNLWLTKDNLISRYKGNE